MNNPKVKYRKWIRILSLAFIINIAITFERGLLFLNMHRHFETNTHITLTLTETDHLLLYDQILANSALLYASTGNVIYKHEYEKADTELTHAIHDIYQVLYDTHNNLKSKKKWFGSTDDDAKVVADELASIDNINKINDKLKEIERRSFKLAEQNSFSAAVAILQSEQYVNLEDTYHHNISNIIENAKKLIAKDNYDVSLQSKAMIIIVAVNTFILLGTWFFSVRAIQRWENAKKRHETELQTINTELEQRVDSRTKQLSEVNGQLLALNTTLENRVEARTHDLMQANDEFRALNESLGRLVQERTEKLQEMNDEFRVLNETLAQSIEDEVKNSREKDGMLLQQSRLAAMGEMMGNIAHQWRQPINALNLVLINIEDAYRHNDLTEEYLKQQIDKGERLVTAMSGTIDDFRNFFKPDSSQEIFDIELSIKDVLNLVEAGFKNHNISVEVSVPRFINTRGFTGQYRQVLLNILGNAKDALLERRIANPKITVTALEENEFAVLRICDNAGGIKADVIDKVFDPYFTTRPQGNGIGLYMSKTIIESNMHGKLQVKNTGDGAEFTIQTEISRELLPHQVRR